MLRIRLLLGHLPILWLDLDQVQGLLFLLEVGLQYFNLSLRQFLVFSDLLINGALDDQESTREPIILLDDLLRLHHKVLWTVQGDLGVRYRLVDRVDDEFKLDRLVLEN